MTVKEWLNRGYEIDRYINSLLAAKAEALNRATSVTVSANTEKVQSSYGNDTERRIIKYAEYSELIDKQVDRLVDVKSEIHKAVDKLEDNTLRTLLVNRYIRFMTWDKIAAEMNYSYYHIVHRLHPRALNALSKIIPDPDIH